MKPQRDWVLVRWENDGRTMFNIIPNEDWLRIAPVYSADWVVVARGTREEVEALARLMPDPKVLTFN